jgi:hypothetical protein
MQLYSKSRVRGEYLYFNISARGKKPLPDARLTFRCLRRRPSLSRHRREDE